MVQVGIAISLISSVDMFFSSSIFVLVKLGLAAAAMHASENAHV
jgi:hypothetical protein